MVVLVVLDTCVVVVFVGWSSMGYTWMTDFFRSGVVVVVPVADGDDAV